MFLFNGWLHVEFSENSSEKQDAQALKIIRDEFSFLKGLIPDGRLLELRVSNGLIVINVSGCENRRPYYWEDLLGFIKNVVNVAQDSYGIFYVRDTQEHISNPDWNQFNVYVAKKGVFSRSKAVDPYLSPCVPEIEDE